MAKLTPDGQAFMTTEKSQTPEEIQKKIAEYKAKYGEITKMTERINEIKEISETLVNEYHSLLQKRRDMAGDARYDMATIFKDIVDYSGMPNPQVDGYDTNETMTMLERVVGVKMDKKNEKTP